ncbi:hypothetical protein ES319_A03G212100v1 [Gossypium barbadense]|uniref:Late embryogenesis abundant protein LEA-2 subgroup domain-containing protein n=1 Tax=Gossypium barbadense TaxID=3634 RepID=A0A5J5WID5_GOSBA|nr:hypothetical protein ES319_A03G212100v1 [Gossypium barbadense]
MENQTRVAVGIPAPNYLITTHQPPPFISTYPTPPPAQQQSLSCPPLFIITSILIIILFVSLAFTGFYFTYQQSNPPIIRIESIVAFNITNWLITLSLKNPNKYASIHYEKIQVSVSEFGDKWRVICPVDEFDQVENGETLMDVDVFGLVMYSKMVEVVLKMDAVVCLQAKYMQKHWQMLEVDCGGVVVRPRMNTTVGRSSRCNVRLR